MAKELTESGKLIALHLALMNHTSDLRDCVDALLADDKKRATRILGAAVKRLKKVLCGQLPIEVLKKLEALERKRTGKKDAGVDVANQRSLDSLKAFMSAARKSGVAR